jgi:hypothetical protein
VLPLDTQQRRAFLSVLDEEETERYFSVDTHDSASAQRSDEWLLSRLLLRWVISMYCPGEPSMEVIASVRNKFRHIYT